MSTPPLHLADLAFGDVQAVRRVEEDGPAGSRCHLVGGAPVDGFGWRCEALAMGVEEEAAIAFAFAVDLSADDDDPTVDRDTPDGENRCRLNRRAILSNLNPDSLMNLPIPICIDHAVGVGGANARLDVRTIQILILMNRLRFSSPHTCTIDGHVTKSLTDLIGDFQTQVVKVVKPTHLVQPSSPTLLALAAGVLPGLLKEKLQLIMPGATVMNIAKYFQPLSTNMLGNQINTPLRMAHFLAQIGHESQDLTYAEEIASGAAYEGRNDLGNTQPGDGARFKGRGLIQLTGRTNYTAYGAVKKQDFLTGMNSKKIATDPNLAVDVSCWFWTVRKLNQRADKDDIPGITFKVNGGFKGLPLRTARLKRAKYWLGLTHGLSI